MKRFCRLSMPLDSIKNISSIYFQDDFCFSFGDKKVYCNKFIADLISPEVESIHRSDQTVNNFEVDYEGSDGDMQLLLSMFTKNHADIPSDKVNDIFDLCLALGNATLARQLRGFMKDNTKENEVSKSDLFIITVQTLLERTFKFEVSPTDTVRTLKEKLHEREGFPIDSQRLLFKGREIDNCYTFDECQIKANSLVNLFFRNSSPTHSNGQIQISIKSLKGQIIKMKVIMDDTVSKLKEQISSIDGVPIENQKLFYRDTELDNTKTLKFYRIRRNAEVQFQFSYNGTPKQIIFTNPFDININSTYDNKTNTYKMNVKSNDTIQHLKQQICKTTNISTELQELIFYEFHLDDTKIIGDYGIEPESTIILNKAKGIKVIVVFLSGKNEYEVTLRDKVRSLKEKVSKKTQIPIEKLRLIYNGDIMIDGEALKFYQIQNGSIIQASQKVDKSLNKDIIKIKIKTSDDEHYDLEVSKNDTIQSLKEKINKIAKIPFEFQRLLYKQCQLEDKNKINDYDISPNSVVIVYNDNKQQVTLTNGKPFIIEIKTIEGEVYEFEVTANDTIQSLKEQIKQKTDFPIEAQRLIYDEKELEDSDRLKDYYILSYSTIYLLIPLEMMKMKTFKINVKTLTPSSIKETYEFEVTFDETIQSLKEKICQRTEISIERQRLIYILKELENSHTLIDYHIFPNSELILDVLKINNNYNPTEKQDKPIHLYLKTLQGSFYEKTVQPNDTIQSLKIKMNQTNKYFINNGIAMNNTDTFKDYHLSDMIFILDDPNEDIPIKIDYAHKKKFVINVKIVDTVLNLKQKISQIEHIPVEQQCLFMNDLILKDSRFLCNFIQAETEIFLIQQKEYLLLSHSTNTNSFPIYIKTLCGCILPFEVSSNDTVEDLKQKISLCTSIPSDQMRVIYAGKSLGDYETFGDCNVTNGSLIHFVTRLRGGKPVIYIYPKEKMDVNVKVNIKGDFTCTYPKYNNETGWNVNVNENGIMTNKDNPNSIEYDSLFWECLFDDNEFKFDEGFVVSKDDAEMFLEEKLYYLGLRGKELISFIQFWLPQIQRSDYTMVKFLSEEYENVAQLEVTPKPDCVIRVFMIMKNLRNNNKVVELPVQNLEKLHKERNGYSVIEWGGSILYDV